MSWDYLPASIAERVRGSEIQQKCKRSFQGAQSRSEGEEFEKIIEASLIFYKSKCVAEIEKTPEPMKPLGKPNSEGRFLACYTKAAQPDFKGTLKGGLSVVFEAKHTDGDRIEYGRLTEDQIERMESHYDLGAVCFVLVSFDLRFFFRIPWGIWRDMKAIYGRKYITLAECTRYRVPYVSGIIELLDGIV